MEYYSATERNVMSIFTSRLTVLKKKKYGLGDCIQVAGNFVSKKSVILFLSWVAGQFCFNDNNFSLMWI